VAEGPGREPAAAFDSRGRRRPWAGRRVVLGVAGGIAAYKSVQLARDLTLLGAEVDVILTRSARSFVGAITFEALTGRPVSGELIAAGHALDHIRLAREAHVVCVAPATADLMSRAAAGRADDLLTALLLATRAPVLLCPAMNEAMWSHPETRANAERLEAVCGYRLVGPVTGPLAWGEGAGSGRMMEPAGILEHIGRALEGDSALRGRRVLVTAGPTREPLDPVRVLTNRSSGRMGFAVAAAAWRRGADVVLITGPTALNPPLGARVLPVETASAMADAVRAEIGAADVLIMAAAVADFRPAQTASAKIRRAAAPGSIALAPVPDILGETRALRAAHAVCVGFALETVDGRESARAKLRDKALDAIVLNRADEAGAGFEVETNRVVLIDRFGREEELPLMAKTEVAEILLDRVEEFLAGTA